MENNAAQWRITRFYGHPDRRQRATIWNLLRILSVGSDLPWCIIGDFNDIYSINEKGGNTPYSNYLNRGFCDNLQDCHLQDLPLQGYQYTWERRRGTSRWIEERLDRAVVTTKWLHRFPHASLTKLVVTSSNHSPIELQAKGMPSTPRK